MSTERGVLVLGGADIVNGAFGHGMLSTLFSASE